MLLLFDEVSGVVQCLSFDSFPSLEDGVTPSKQTSSGVRLLRPSSPPEQLGVRHDKAPSDRDGSKVFGGEVGGGVTGYRDLRWDHPPSLVLAVLQSPAFWCCYTEH